MEDNSFISNSKSATSWPVAMLITVLLALVIEGALYANRKALLPWVYILMEEKREVLSAEKNPDVAIFGDSRLFHMKPDIVEEALGVEEAVNLAWTFFGAESYPWVLQEYLQYNDPPKAIVMNIQGNFFAFKEERNLLPDDPLVANRMYIYLSPSSVVKRLFQEGRWYLLWDYSRYLMTPPSLKYQERLSGHIRNLSQMRGPQAMRENDIRQWEEWQNDGAFSIFYEDRHIPRAFELFREDVGEPAAYDNQTILKYVEDFFALAERHGIPVIVLNSPESKFVESLYTEANTDARMKEVLVRLEEKYPNIILAPPYTHSFPNDYFGDPVHLNHKGRLRHEEVYRQQLEEVRPRLKEMLDQRLGDK